MYDIYVPKSTTAPIKDIANHFGVDYDDALHHADWLMGRDRSTVHQEESLRRSYANSDNLVDFRNAMRDYVWHESGMVPHLQGTYRYG